MKKAHVILSVLAAGVIAVAAVKVPGRSHIDESAVQSISALTFGPDGVLFIGDSKSAKVFALQTKDVKKQKSTAVQVKQIDQKIAAALGTAVNNITITDMAVNPVSKKLYIAVQNSDGTPVLLTMEGDQLKTVSLQDPSMTAVALNNAPAPDAKDGRGRSLRVSAISDLGFADGKLLVSGLSNHEFSSSLKSIPYPFTTVQDEATLEIYHASHGRYETSAPIRTFTTAVVNGKRYLVASYTCTPLVLFPMEELKAGSHVKGRTVAEMGSGNSPIDMLSFKNGSDLYLLMANTKYPVAKVDYKSIASFEGSLAEPVKGTAGTPFTATPMSNVLQMDKLDEAQVVMVQKQTNGDVDLLTANDTSF